MKDYNLKILIAGEGGQGVQVIGEILNMAAYKDGLQTVYIPNYGVEQRGGVSLAYLQISDSPIAYPKFKIADILAVLCERAIMRVKNYHSRDTRIINGMAFLEKPKEHGFSPRTYNMVVLGVLSGFLPVKPESVLRAMAERFKKAPKELMFQNKKAFMLGRGLANRMPFSAYRLKALKVKDHRKGPSFVKTSEGKPQITVTIHPKYCKSCGICIYRCPTKALHFSSKITGVYGSPISEVDISKCIACGMCERVCPDCAIEVKRKKAKHDT